MAFTFFLPSWTRFSLATIVVGAVAAGCSSEQQGIPLGSSNPAVAASRVDPRMSAMGQRARRAALQLNAGATGSGGPTGNTTQGASCRNDVDCGDDMEFVDDGPNGGGQAEYSIAVDETGQHVVVGFNDTRGFTKDPISVSGFAYSDDGGQTFVDGGQLPSPGTDLVGTTKYPQNFGDAEVKYLGACTFIYSSILMKKFSATTTAQTMGIHRSTDCGHTWTGPFEVTSVTNPNGILKGAAPADVADKEFMDVDPDTGRVMLSWTNFSPSGKAGVQISTTYSDDILSPTPTWSAAKVVSGDAHDGQASIPRFAGRGSPNAYIAWRKFPGGNQNNVGFARSIDNGATFGTPITLSPTDFLTMDEVLGNDRINTSPSLAVDTGDGPQAGSIYVVYANNDGHDGSDIAFQRSLDEGVTFSAPIKINSRPGSDRAQWVPWVTVDASTGRVWVFYNDQGAADSGDLTQSTVTYSDDGGGTWSQPRPLSERPYHAGWGNDTGQPNLGDYNQAVAQYGDLYAVWAGTHPVGYADGQPASVSFTVPEMAFRKTHRAQRMVADLGAVTFTGAGNDGNLDPGDVARLHIPLRNYVTNALSAKATGPFTANLSTTTPGVSVVYSDRRYPSIAPGATAESVQPFTISLDPSFVPGTDIEFEINVWSAPVRLHYTQHTGTPAATTIFAEDFESATAGALPASWTQIHGGGRNTVPWTGTGTFCGTTSNAAFHANAEDGIAGVDGGAPGSPTRFERLLSPKITIPADAAYVTLDMDVCYDTEDDPNFNVLAYDGLVLRMTDFTAPPRQLRSVLVEAFEDEFTTGSFFGYPKHLPRSSDTKYFQDMSAWAGDSGGMKHVRMRLPGMAGSTVQLRFEYTQDGGGICSDVRPGHSCGVLVDNIVVNSVKAGVPAAPTR